MSRSEEGEDMNQTKAMRVPVREKDDEGRKRGINE